MVYETTIPGKRLANRAIANFSQAVLLVGFGVLFGLILAQAPERSASANWEDGLQVDPIHGEDWHGNVRRSSSPR